MPATLPLIFLLLTPQTGSTDALALLNEVGQKYADAKTYHIEAVEEQTFSNELSRSWQKTLMTAIAAPGGKYHYEGRSGHGSAILVSDGTTEWDYHLDEHLYTQTVAAQDDSRKKRIPMEEMPLMTVKILATKIAHQSDSLKSASFLPDETIAVGGRNVDCYVVHYSDADYRTTPKHKLEWTLWIDKSNKTVVKTASREQSEEMPYNIPILIERTMAFSVVELNQPEPAEWFRFTPPGDARLVAEFPDPFPRAASSEAASLVGVPAPELELKSADGKVTMLSSFHGRPVFLDFWATWCGPCVVLLKDLKDLYGETEGKGLVWIGIDSDKELSTVAAFLARERLAWPDYHDQDGSLGKAFHRQGIPLGVLIDAKGNVVFYKSGYDAAELRAAIARLGPEFRSVEKPAESSSSNPVKTSQ